VDLVAEVRDERDALVRALERHGARLLEAAVLDGDVDADLRVLVEPRVFRDGELPSFADDLRFLEQLGLLRGGSSF
jgi:hypothetical protein